MATRILVHMDLADESGVVWWAESTILPGWTAAADTLADLEQLCLEAADAMLGSDARLEIRFDLATQPPATSGEAVTPTVGGNLRVDNGQAAFAARSTVLAPA